MLSAFFTLCWWTFVHQCLYFLFIFLYLPFSSGIWCQNDKILHVAFRLFSLNGIRQFSAGISNTFSIAYYIYITNTVILRGINLQMQQINNVCIFHSELFIFLNTRRTNILIEIYSSELHLNSFLLWFFWVQVINNFVIRVLKINSEHREILINNFQIINRKIEFLSLFFYNCIEANFYCVFLLYERSTTHSNARNVIVFHEFCDNCYRNCILNLNNLFCESRKKL